MAGSGSKFDSLVKQANETQKRYIEVSDLKKSCMGSTLVMFRGKGDVLDIGYEDAYADIYKNQGFRVTQFNLPQDMHDEIPGCWPRIIARHVLEHSICPLLVIQRIFDALAEDGQAIIVVPKASDYMAKHEGHYTVLLNSGWRKLFEFVGFKVDYEMEARWSEHKDYIETRFLLSK